MPARVAIFFAPGLEECEGLITVDLLRRAGVEVDIVSINGEREVVSARQAHIVCDKLIGEIVWDSYDMLILPGGMPGTTNLAACDELCAQLRAFAETGKAVSAICAAPTVLGGLGLLQGRRATCYPDLQDQLAAAGAQVVSDQAVVVDDNITTSQGLGTAIDFGLALVARFCGQDKADALARGVVHGVL